MTGPRSVAGGRSRGPERGTTAWVPPGEASCPLHEAVAVGEGAVADVERDAGALEQLVELVPDVAAQPAGTGGEPVDDGERIGVAGERGVVAQRAQRREGGLRIDVRGEVDAEREPRVGIEARRDDLHATDVAARPADRRPPQRALVEHLCRLALEPAEQRCATARE